MAIKIASALPEHLINKKTRYEILKELAHCYEMEGNSEESLKYYKAALE